MNDNGGKALIIGGGSALRRTLVGLCGGLGLSARGAVTRDEAGAVLRREYQDLIILCGGVRGKAVPELIGMIRGMDLDSCILIAAPAREGGAIVQCLKSGAYDTILTPVRRRWAEIVIARAMERRMYYAGSRLKERYRRMALHDTLTGLYNHRYFQQQLGLGVGGAIRYGYPLTVMLVDLDDFKEYNDRHGHLEGDRALRAVGRILGGSIRAQDTVARYGGEEFGLILPHTGKIAARHIAARLCSAVEGLRCTHGRRRPAGPLTVSIGVATYPHDGDAPEALLGRADRALYAAKHAGKNRVRG